MMRIKNDSRNKCVCITLHTKIQKCGNFTGEKFKALNSMTIIKKSIILFLQTIDLKEVFFKPICTNLLSFPFPLCF